MQKYYELSPQVYDDQFWWKKNDLLFWDNEFCKLSGQSVLELAAGTGRIGNVLIEKCQYVGLELSSQYVKYANDKLSDTEHPYFIQGDMRFFSLDEVFNYIFIGFNSLLHLLSEKDISQCLESIKNHMNENSIFYIDVFSPHHHHFAFAEEQHEIVEFFDSDEKCQSTIIENIKYDSQLEIVDVKWDYSNGRDIYRSFKFKMKILYPDTLSRILVDHGFKINSIWGSYNKEKFMESSEKQIYQCTLQ